MTKLTEKQQNRLLKKIDRYKKAMRYEKSQWGGYHDGQGLRYAIADLYFQLNDYKKTNRYLNWFYKTFPDDATYTKFKIGAANSYYEARKYQKSIDLLIEVNRNNTYILPILFGDEKVQQNKEEQYEFETIAWAKENKDELLELTSSDFFNWATEFIQNEQYQKWYAKYISILILIKDADTF